MTLKRFLTLFALLSILISSMASAAPAMAGVTEDNSSAEAAEACRAYDESGLLDQYGLNRGECVNLLAAGDNLNRLIVGYCGFDVYQDFYGNKGQCVSALHEFVRESQETQQ